MVAVILGSLFLVASVTWLLWSAFSPYAVWQRKDILFQICYGMYGFMDLVCIGKLKIFKQHRLWFKTVTISIFLIGHSNWSLQFFADLFSADTFGKCCFLQCCKYVREKRIKETLLSDSSAYSQNLSGENRISLNFLIKLLAKFRELNRGKD